MVKGLLAVKAIFDKAEKGDVSAFLALSNRMDGQPKATVENTSPRVLQIIRPGKRKKGTIKDNKADKTKKIRKAE